MNHLWHNLVHSLSNVFIFIDTSVDYKIFLGCIVLHNYHCTLCYHSTQFILVYTLEIQKCLHRLFHCTALCVIYMWRSCQNDTIRVDMLCLATAMRSGPVPDCFIIVGQHIYQIMPTCICSFIGNPSNIDKGQYLSQKREQRAILDIQHFPPVVVNYIVAESF